MRLPYVLLILGLSVFGPGCGLLKFGCMNAVEGPLDDFNDLADCLRSRHLADKAWDEFQGSNVEHAYSVHFVRGFKDGYVDYLEYGGTGAPPVAPPWIYQKTGYETPQGVQAIEDWFAGFRQGAGAAQASGIRQVILLPVSVGRPPAYPAMQQAVQSPSDSVLPAPRPVGPELTPETKP